MTIVVIWRYINKTELNITTPIPEQDLTILQILHSRQQLIPNYDHLRINHVLRPGGANSSPRP